MSDEGKARILVVDDDPGMRRSVERVLSPPYELALADGASRAVELARQREFRVALVDVQLGVDGDGFEVCRRIRELCPETDVILMTGSMSHPDEKLFRSLEEDAFYFLFKPFERRVLLALVDRCLRLQDERRAKESYARVLGEDLERARRFQRSLLPRGPVAAGGWYVHGLVSMCDALGGDFYYSLAERDGSLVFAVGDIVGHGVSAAMYAGMLRSTLDMVRRHDPDPAAVIGPLLDGADFLETSRYATLFYGRLLPDGRLRYFNAGHPPGLWQRNDGEPQRLGATGLFLTRALAGRRREARQIEMSPGDRLLIYTDGVTEALDPADSELGLAGLEESFRQAACLPASRVAEMLLERVRTHAGGRPLGDDATLLLIERRP